MFSFIERAVKFIRWSFSDNEHTSDIKSALDLNNTNQMGYNQSTHLHL